MQIANETREDDSQKTIMLENCLEHFIEMNEILIKQVEQLEKQNEGIEENYIANDKSQIYSRNRAEGKNIFYGKTIEYIEKGDQLEEVKDKYIKLMEKQLETLEAENNMLKDQIA